jgi:segregation and condensation protein B
MEELSTEEMNKAVMDVAEGVVETVEAAPVDNTPKITDLTQIEQALEALIFASPRPISLVRLRNILNSFQYETANLKDILEALEQTYERKGFQLVKVSGGYQFRTHAEHSPLLQKLLEEKPVRLSGSALEVLAIIAYKQPITRSEIDAVRGIDSGHLLKGLLEKNLIRTLGHSETAGRPLLYGSAQYFLEVFSLNSLDDLPAIEEFQRELLKSTEGAEGEAVVLAPELSLIEGDNLLTRASPLAAEPDRGAFDAPAEERDEKPDFGVEERALTES